MSASERHIVFDWNGTLLNDIDALCHCTNLLLGMEGHQPVSLDFFQTHYSIPFSALYQNLGLNDHEVGRLMALENEAFHSHYEPMATKAPLREGAKQALDHVQALGIKSYILSNHLVEPIRVQLRRLAIEPYFEEVLAYADASVQFRDMTKGERLRRYRAKNDALETPTLIIGDSVEEIEIAREQNLISVGLTGGCVSEERLRAAHPDYLIHSLLELPPILSERGFDA